MGSNLTGNFNPETLGKNLLGIGARGIINAGVGQAVYGDEAGRFGDAFLSSVVGDLAAVSANAVGQQTPAYSPQNLLGHAAVGAAAAHLRGQDAVAGAIGGLGAALINPTLDQAIGGEDGLGWGNDLASASRNQQMTLQLSSTIVSGGLAAALDRPYLTAMNAAHNETINNYLTRENILAKHQRLAAAQTAAERQRIARESRKESQGQDSEARDLAGKLYRQNAPLNKRLETLERSLSALLTDEARADTLNEIAALKNQIEINTGQILGTVYQHRQELVALSNDQAQPEHIRQEALRNIEMIDGDFRVAAVTEQYALPVLGTIATLPLSGGLAAVTANASHLVKVGAGVVTGSSFYALGQWFKGEPIRHGELLFNGLTGGFAVPLFKEGAILRNAAVGGMAGGANAQFANWSSGDNKSVIGTATVNAIAAGAGTYIGSSVSGSLNRNLPSHVSPSYATWGGETVKSAITDLIPAALPDIKAKENKP